MTECTRTELAIPHEISRNLIDTPSGSSGSTSSQARHTGQSQPLKRKRKKGSSACSACQQRKSRCELVNSQGCRRCRVLGSTCSLRRTDISPLSNETGDQGENNVGQIDEEVELEDSESQSHRMLSEILERTRNIESAQQQLLARQAGRPTITPFIFKRSDNQLRRAEQEAVQSSVIGSTHPGFYSATFMMGESLGLSEDRYFMDPLQAEICTEEVMTLAYQKAAHAFRSALPILQDISYHDSPPHHPFLQCCILYYATINTGNEKPLLDFSRYIRLAQILDRCLSSISANPSVDLVLALLILSLKPLNVFKAHLPHPHAISETTDLAMRMALSLGLDSDALKLSSIDSSEIFRDHYMPMLHRAQIWYTVANLSKRIDILSSSLLYSRPSCAPPIHHVITAIQAEAHKISSILHISLESEFLSLFEPVSKALIKLRTSTVFHRELLDEVMYSMNQVHDQAEIWRHEVRSSSLISKSHLMVSSLLTELIMYLKLSDDLGGSLPSPLGVETRFPYMIEMGGCMFLRSNEALQLSVETNLDLSILPEFDISLLLLAYATSYQGSRHGAADDDENATREQAINKSLRRNFRQMFGDLHLDCKAMLDMIEQLEPPSKAWQDGRDGMVIDQILAEFTNWDRFV